MSGGGTAAFDRNRLSALMGERGLDLLLATSRHNVRYLTGGYCYPLYLWDAHTRGSQYLPFFVIPGDAASPTAFIGRPGERDVLAEAGVAVGTCHESVGIGTRPAAAKTVEVLREMGLERGTIGVELPSLPADAFAVLREGLPGATLVDAVPVLDALRAVKSPAEIDLMRRGTVLNAESLAVVLEGGREGDSTAKVARAVEREMRLRGLHHLYALVCAGPSFFRAPTERLHWHRGGVLHVDTGAMLDGYIAELCRTAVLGAPSALAERMLAGCRALEAAVLPVLREGSPAREVQRAGDELLRGHPLGRYGAFIAHGIGLVHHEDPVIDSRSTAVLRSGMVVSIEMEFRHEEVGHVKIEDMVAVGAAGAELLVPTQDAWIVCRG